MKSYTMPDRKLPDWKIPIFQRQHILMAIGYGVLLMMWLTPEDNTVAIVSLLGAGLSLVLVLLAMLRWLGGRRLSAQQWIPAWVILGALAGFGAVWTTVFLMIFKNAWHSHAAPDFATLVVVGIMHRVVAWTTAGALLGGASACIRIALHE